VLFDAVEFDDAIATVDVLDDLAFLIMDLIARGVCKHQTRVSRPAGPEHVSEEKIYL